mmetsp:Transcript_68690/g.183359  ORF Transcript_68690/g.183359 Transcript_68690/m.183359 type:complete len:330 (-) Transcript_68690:142-1131(-)
MVIPLRSLMKKSVDKPREVLGNEADGRAKKSVADDRSKQYYSNIPVHNLYSILEAEPCLYAHAAFPDSQKSSIDIRESENVMDYHQFANHLPLKRSNSSEFIDAGLSPLDMLDTGTATRPFLATHTLERRKFKRRELAARVLRPYVEKGLMSGFIYMLGEAISCGLFSKNGTRGFNPDAFVRYSVLHSTLIGMFANGPLLHLFFEMVDKYVKFESKLLSLTAKVVIDQVIWGCVWNFCYILLMNLATDSPGFGYIGEGLGLDFLVDLCKGFHSAFGKAVDWRLHAQLLAEGLRMLPMDIICYWLVPLPLRALWVTVVDVFWVTILSRYD